MRTGATPNLKAISDQLPRTRIGILRNLWPTIQTCLDTGHSLRDIHESLRLDGIEMAYSTFCWAVGALRQRLRAAVPRQSRATAPHSAGETAGHKRAPDDPLRNVRILSEHRPGFDYHGTLPDEKLFGLKEGGRNVGQRKDHNGELT
jgi:hypothetical protein